MKDFTRVLSQKKLLIFSLLLFFTPFMYFLSYFLAYMFFMFFGEVIQLTYIQVIFTSLLSSLISFLVFKKQDDSTESGIFVYYLFSILIPFIVVFVIVFAIVLAFGLII